MGAALLLVLLVAAVPLSAAAGDAHPGYSDEGTCTVGAELRRLEERGRGRIIDITHAYVPDLPAFATGAVTGPVVRLKESMADGSEYNLSELRMDCHTGTHVDAPGHMNQGHFAAGIDVDALDLDVLNGELRISSEKTPGMAFGLAAGAHRAGSRGAALPLRLGVAGRDGG